MKKRYCCAVLYECLVIVTGVEVENGKALLLVCYVYYASSPPHCRFPQSSSTPVSVPSGHVTCM